MIQMYAMLKLSLPSLRLSLTTCVYGNTPVMSQNL